MHKKLFCLISALFFSVVLIANAGAFNVEAPGSMIVFDSPRDFFVTVKNDSPIEQALKVRFFSPAISNLSYIPAKISGNSKADFSITINPSKSLEGQAYESTLIVELGNEKIIRTIDLSFKKHIVSAPAPEPQPSSGVDLAAISSGFFSLAAFGSENALIIALAFIAAILLIAFIARFVRRVN
ncbi:MAG: hypothetical protein PHH08_01170 [Candidatus ainarchaeum sp.]|nr:hypothetical protein [Candidatus ainarchaeum sp.]